MTLSTNAMKKATLFFLGAAAFTWFVFAADTAPASKSKPQSLVGTWELVSEKWDDAKTFTSPPAERKSLKFVTPTHFIWVWVDPKQKISNSMGGTYQLDGTSYIETVQFAAEGMDQYVGKQQKFTARIEGDKWIHSGVLSGGQKLEEIWKRVK
jgi:hypothetical protein